jgi:4-aminobutyrate aminotransferase-like enzyme
MADTKTAFPARMAPHGGPIQLFYQTKDAIRRPIVARADGIYMWDTDRRRYIDASSGAVVSNIGHVNPRVLAASQAAGR